MIGFDENGFALDSGVISAYVCSPDTRELIGMCDCSLVEWLGVCGRLSR